MGSSTAPTLRPLRWRAMLVLAAWVTAASAYGIWVMWPSRTVDPASVLYVAVGVGFVATGALLRFEPAQRITGALFVAAGFAWLTNELGARLYGPLPTIGWLSAPVDELLIMVILLRYPHPRIGDRTAARAIAATIACVLGLHVLSGVTWDPSWSGWPESMWWPTLLPLRSVQPYLWYAYLAIPLPATAVVVALVVRRIRQATGLARRELTPVAVTTTVIAINVAARAVMTLTTGLNDVGEPLWIATEVLMLLVPSVFAITAVRRRLDRATAADIVTEIAQPATVATVREALRRALADPGLDVLVWLPEHGKYVDGDGVPVDLVGHDGTADSTVESAFEGRFRRHLYDARGGPLALILTDPSLDRRADVVDVAVRAAALSLENARLHADLLARMLQLEESRARVIEAGVAERRRVERDLHDGAQQRLLALATTLGRVHAAAADTSLRQLTDQARTELRRALRDLRDLARGIHPAVLEQIGLAAAVEAVAESLPTAVELRIDAGRLTGAVETTAYFVICEALANVVKHANATRAVVTVHRDNGLLCVAVSDDGAGGAVVAPGGGLGGLADRVAALSGRITVDSPVGAGTRLTVELPCA